MGARFARVELEQQCAAYDALNGFLYRTSGVKFHENIMFLVGQECAGRMSWMDPSSSLWVDELDGSWYRCFPSWMEIVFHVSCVPSAMGYSRMDLM